MEGKVTPGPMIVAVYYCFVLVICVSICLLSICPYFHLSKCQWIFISLLILWKSGLGLLMVIFFFFKF